MCFANNYDPPLRTAPSSPVFRFRRRWRRTLIRRRVVTHDQPPAIRAERGPVFAQLLIQDHVRRLFFRLPVFRPIALLRRITRLPSRRGGNRKRVPRLKRVFKRLVRLGIHKHPVARQRAAAGVHVGRNRPDEQSNSDDQPHPRNNLSCRFFKEGSHSANECSKPPFFNSFFKT